MSKTLVLVPSEIEGRLLWGDHFPPFYPGPFKAWQTTTHAWAIAGVGATATALTTAYFIKEWTPSRVVLVGIAGAYHNSGLQLRDVVQVRTDRFVDLGFEQNGRLIDLDTMDLPLLPGQSKCFGSRFEASLLDPSWQSVSALTVNRITASNERAQQLTRQFDAQIEQMEGAGVALACALHKTPFFHVRSISNKVGPRDPRSWQIEPACKSLKAWLHERL